MLVWKWANFLLLAAGAAYLLNKHLPPYFKSRTGEIQKDISEAQATKQAADKRASEMDARLNSLAADIETFRAQAKIEMGTGCCAHSPGNRAPDRKTAETGPAGDRIPWARSRRDLHAYASKLSLDLAEQRIRTRVDAATEAGLVDDFTKDLGSRN